MQDSNIIIISNDKIKAELLASKILFLRTLDSVGIYNFNEAIVKLKTHLPDLLILQSSKMEDIEIVKTITANKPLNFPPIIFVPEIINQDVLCKAYDYGISDYFTLDYDDAQILMKIMWGVQKKQLLNDLQKKNNILISLDVLDKESNFYTKQHSEKAFKAEFTSIVDSAKDAIFMSLTADISCKNILTQTFLASLLKKQLRKSDIIGFAPDNKFYIIFNDTDEEGVRTIFKKINESFLDAYTISAAAAKIKDSDFITTERLVNKALSEALIQKNSLIIIDENINKKDVSWIDKSDLKDKNFKMFKQTFMKKIDKTITPAFFQMQTVLKDKLFETTIEQYVNDTESVFSLQKSDYKMIIRIKYPGYSKINVDIIEDYPDDKNSERITLEPQELTPIMLDDIMLRATSKFQQKILSLD